MSTPSLPSIGLGTMKNTDPESIARAIEMGYRHLDTAQKYENEASVGTGLRQANVAREDLFLATKVAEYDLAYDDVLRTTKESLNKLKVDTVDLLYAHWPAISGEIDRYDPYETFKAFNLLLDNVKMRHVGVANFTTELIEEAQENLDAPIFGNQVEMHPLLQQEELVSYAQATDMYLVAYCPLMRGAIDEVPELKDIAEKHDTSPAQVSLAWLQRKDNVVPIPKSGGAHLQENFESRNLSLDDKDLDRIDAIQREKRVVNPAKGPWNW